MLAIADKAVALLTALTPADLAAMAPAERRRFAAACRYAAQMAEPKPDAPKTGVLRDLRQGARAE